MKRVRVNATYRFVPNLWDRLDGAHLRGVQIGDLVTVVNMPGCPSANTYGQCYIAKDGKFVGMVSVGSLHRPTCGVKVDVEKRVIDERPCVC